MVLKSMDSNVSMGSTTLKATPGGRKSVWDRRVDYEKKHGPLTEAFELPPKEKQAWRNPLDH